MEERYIFTQKTKYYLVACMGLGAVFLILGLVLQESDGHRIWANVLLNNLLFLYIALFGAAFLALHKIAWSGWHTSIQRIPEAMSSFLPISALLMLLIYFGMHEIYHWTHADPHDTVLLGKAPYLNLPFFFIRMVVYFAGWIVLAWMMRRNSLAQDLSPDLKYYRRGKIFGALFMVFFAVTISTSSWDWLMSIDAHWFSTLYGWYVFIGMFEIGLAAMILLIAFLKTQGYFGFINREHIHDMGKYLFGFSIFWAYLWFSQYLLIWYSHIPEETIYFQPRLKEFTVLFFVNLVLNFLIPLLALMTRDSKRNLKWLSGVAAIVLVGHWVDLYLMIMPGTVGDKASIGLLEIGGSLLYLGVFLFVILSNLSRVPIVSKNDPLLQESFHYET